MTSLISPRDNVVVPISIDSRNVDVPSGTRGVVLKTPEPVAHAPNDHSVPLISTPE